MGTQTAAQIAARPAWRTQIMPIFLIRGRYTRESMAAMLDKPEDRAQALRGFLEQGGGRLIEYYVTFGDDDFLLITEAPDEKAVLAALVPPAASGAVTDLKTCLAITSAQAKDAFAQAKANAAKYRRPGG
jgi:uncharacterized protein with GYD domain